MRRELEIAQEVQAQLFPQTRPEMATLDYAGLCRAARGVGGDYFDFIVVGPDQLGIAVGDVAGKGISAALLMATLQGALRSHAPRRGTALAELLGDVNRLMYGSVSGGRFATFFYGVYDDARRALIYANAGHNPPLVVRPARNGGPPSCCAWSRPGWWSGSSPTSRTSGASLPLAAGDLLVIYTDGVTEAQRADGEQFGEERLAELATALAERPVREVNAEILAAIDAFVGDAPQQDDITLIVGRVRLTAGVPAGGSPVACRRVGGLTAGGGPSGGLAMRGPPRRAAPTSRDDLGPASVPARHVRDAAPLHVQRAASNAHFATERGVECTCRCAEDRLEAHPPATEWRRIARNPGRPEPCRSDLRPGIAPAIRKCGHSTSLSVATGHSRRLSVVRPGSRVPRSRAAPPAARRPGRPAVGPDPAPGRRRPGRGPSAGPFP